MALLALLLCGCAPRALLVKGVTDQLARQGSADEDDVVLVRDAAAYCLKFAESVDWVRGVIPNRYLFLLAMCAFLFAAAALTDIYAAIVVLVPLLLLLLLPLARSYGIDPLHFGINFLAAGFLCPLAGTIQTGEGL